MKNLQIIGPLASNFSYAFVNRGLAKALSEVQNEFDVKLFQTKERIDKWPDDEDFAKHPYLKSLWQQNASHADVAIYNDYPKGGHTHHGFKTIDSDIKLMYLAWEESVYPDFWVKETNEHLHGVMVASTFVKEILQNSGVKIPIEVVPCALDDDKRVKATQKFDLKTSKKFKFLHISSAKMRKGIDVLIKSYFSAFTNDDDVCLVIKSNPGPDNMVENTIRKYRKKNSPEIEHIFNSDLAEQDIVNLVNSCDVSVYPSRAEGFGLPVLESMFHKRPVIATNYSAYLDFLNEDNGFLIDYKIVDAIDSEMVNVGAKWAEPDWKDLARVMKEFYNVFVSEGKFVDKNNDGIDSDLTESDDSNNFVLTKKQILQKIFAAKKAADEYTWRNSAKKALSFINKISQVAHFKKQRAGVISFYNNKDGLAEYTAHLFNKIESSFEEFYYLANSDVADKVADDASNVIRCWESGETKFKNLLKIISEKKLNIIHIQYHSGINFSSESLDFLIKSIKELNVKVFVTLHAVKSESFDLSSSLQNLALANRVIVHNKTDYNYLKPKLDNVELFTLPKLEPKQISKRIVKKSLGLNDYYPIIITHGYMNSQKTKLTEVIKAVSNLKKSYQNILHLALNAVSSNNLSSQSEYEACVKVVKELNLSENVIFVKEFLDEKLVEVMFKSSDINILAYKDVGETASAAINKCLASGNPTVVTNIKMFDEFEKEVYKIERADSELIYNAIIKILEDTDLKKELSNNASSYINQNSYFKKSLETLIIYEKSWGGWDC